MGTITEKMQSFLCEQDGKSYLCGHGACETCAPTFQGRSCPSCSATVKDSIRNLQLEQAAAFMNEKRKELKSEVLHVKNELQERRNAQNELLQELETLRGSMANKEQEIIQKKTELDQLKGKTSAEEREKLDLQKKIEKMEEDLVRTRNHQEQLKEKCNRAQLQKEEEERYLLELRQEIEGKKEGKEGQDVAANGYSWWVNSLRSFWDSSSPDFIHPMERYEMKGRLGKSFRNSKVSLAVKDQLASVAVKKFVYNTNVLFPGYLQSFTKKLWLSSEDHVRQTQEDTERRKTEIQNVFREPMLLHLFQNCPHINALKHLIRPSERGCLYVELPYVTSDLEVLVEEKEMNKLCADTLGVEGVRSLMYQLVLGVACMHEAKVTHRNLCPSSILIEPHNNSLQICSFSNAISILTLEQCTPGYSPSDKRFVAPELWCYSHGSIPPRRWLSVDMWAIGCLFAYILRGDVLFPVTAGQSKSDWLGQIYNISECRPDTEEVSQSFPHPTSLQDWIEFSSEDEYDLLSRLLAFNPEKRLTIQQALAHPYFKSFHSKRTRGPSSMRCTDDKIISYFDSLQL